MKFLTKKWLEESNKITYGQLDDEMQARIQWVEGAARLSTKYTEKAVKTLGEEVDFDRYIEEKICAVERNGTSLTISFGAGEIIIENPSDIQIAAESEILKAVELEYVSEREYVLYLLTDGQDGVREIALQCSGIQAKALDK